MVNILIFCPLSDSNIKRYEERLHCLKQERRNRQALIEAFRMCKGLSRLKLNELFTLDDNVRRTRGHSLIVKFWCTWDWCKYFLYNNY